MQLILHSTIGGMYICVKIVCFIVVYIFVNITAGKQCTKKLFNPVLYEEENVLYLINQFWDWKKEKKKKKEKWKFECTSFFGIPETKIRGKRTICLIHYGIRNINNEKKKKQNGQVYRKIE